MPASITAPLDFLIEFKTRTIRERLAGRAGVVVVARDGLAAAIKSPDVIQITRKPERGTVSFIWGVAGSLSERRDFLAEYAQFEGGLKSSFSERDLNLFLAHDFITSFLKEKFFGWNPEPVALEFFVGGTLNNEAFFFIINFDGTSRVLKDESDFEIIGCTGLDGGRKEKEELKERLRRLKVAELSAEEVRVRLITFLEPFPGLFLSSILVSRSSTAGKKKSE